MKVRDPLVAWLGFTVRNPSPGPVQKNPFFELKIHPKSNLDIRVQNFARIPEYNNLDASVLNKILTYSTRIGIGTPAQFLDVMVDTGTSDLWVSAASDISSNYFNMTQSSSVVVNDTIFAVNNIKDSGIGTWVTDKVSIGGASVLNLPFGTLNTSFSASNASEGVLGLGPTFQESSLTLEYPNFLRKLKDQGFINKTAFSVFLNSPFKGAGSLLFGAVDSSKYSGNLYTVPMPAYHGLEANLTKIKVNGDEILWSPAFLPLDTGTAICFFPPDVFIAISARVKDMHYVGGAFFADSTTFNLNQVITFEFSGAKIHVLIKDIMIQTKDLFLPSAGIPLNYDLVLGIFPNTSSSGRNILGLTFLRSAYVVYDLEAWEISLAQANIQPRHNITKSFYKPIISSVPGAQPAPLLKI